MIRQIAKHKIAIGYIVLFIVILQFLKNSSVFLENMLIYDNAINLDNLSVMRKSCQIKEKNFRDWLTEVTVKKSRDLHWEGQSVGVNQDDNQTVKLVSVLCSNHNTSKSRLMQGIHTLVKSLVLFGDSNIDYMIVVDSQQTFAHLSLFLNPLIQKYPHFNKQRFLRLVKRIVWYPAEYRSPCGTGWSCADARLFLPSILSDVSRVIYVDTDFVFFRPISRLWSAFDKFNEAQAFGFSFYDYEGYEEYIVELVKNYTQQQSNNPEDTRANALITEARLQEQGLQALNSGLILMDLDKIRAMDWNTAIIQIANQYYNQTLFLCDQPIYHLYFLGNKDTIFVLPCEWNFRARVFTHKWKDHYCRRLHKVGVSAAHFGGRTAVLPASYNFHISGCLKNASLDMDLYAIVHSIRQCFSKGLSRWYVDIAWPRDQVTAIFQIPLKDKLLSLVDENMILSNSIVSGTFYDPSLYSVFEQIYSLMY